jgi:hypothetical protein
MKTFLSLCAVAVVFLFVAWVAPDEGMWLLTQVQKLPYPEMQKHGLTLSPEQIYSPDGVSLKDAIVRLPGGTGSFVSDKGLIVTNHHIAFSALQSVSSVQADYLKNGLSAATYAEEVPVPNYTAQYVTSVKDITAEIMAAVSDTMNTDDRMKSIRAKSAEIEKAAKTSPDMNAQVSETYSGARYFLYTYAVLKDVRIVYAPPETIGNYGGEVDNWMWPRHTGDFSFMRAYIGPDGKPATYAKENVPFKPVAFLPVSLKGVKEGSYAMVMGFPGRTFRYRTSYEIALAKDESLPLTMRLFKTRMDIIDAAGKNNREVELKYASIWRRMANTYKNYQGTLEGMQRADILKQRTTQEKAFTEFLASKPELQQKYSHVLPGIASAYADLKSFNRKSIVFNQFISGINMVGLANQFKNYANSYAEQTSGKKAAPEQNVKTLTSAITSTFKDHDEHVDRETMVALMLLAADLPAADQIAAVKNVTGESAGAEREKKVREFVGELYKESKLTRQEECTKLMEASDKDILNDPLVKFAVSLDADSAPLTAKTNSFNGKMTKLRTELLQAWMAWKGDDLYADANSTLRITYGEVKPYDPRDAVHYDYKTTLTGLMEKETGTDPFIVPPKLRQLWEKKDFGRYADPATGDVPIAFLANLDITGGNSGSPVINGSGELIGLAFDGNWEAVVGDYIYQEPLNRSINVDSRYILFFLDKYSNAQNIISELVIR